MSLVNGRVREARKVLSSIGYDQFHKIDLLSLDSQQNIVNPFRKLYSTYVPFRFLLLSFG